MKHNKRRRGLTLIEIIISIAIYAVLALLVAEIMSMVNMLMKSTDQMNKRLTYEAKYADNLQSDGNFAHQPVNIWIQLGETVGGSTPVYLHGAGMEGTLYTGSDKKLVDTELIDSSANFHQGTNYKFVVYSKNSLVSHRASDFYTVTLKLLGGHDSDEIGLVTYEQLIPSDPNTVTPTWVPVSHAVVEEINPDYVDNGDKYTVNSDDSSTVEVHIPLLLSIDANPGAGIPNDINVVPLNYDTVKDDLESGKSDWTTKLKMTIYNKSGAKLAEPEVELYCATLVGTDYLNYYYAKTITYANDTRTFKIE